MNQRQKFLSPVQSWALIENQSLETRAHSGFPNLNKPSATPVPRKYVTYKPPVVVKGKRWYVQYWYLVPIELRDKYKKQYLRFRVFEEINKYRKDDYAQLLRQAVEIVLQNGWSPFEKEVSEMTIKVTPTEWSLSYGLDKYMEHCVDQELRPKTIQSYGTVINYLKEYFYKDNRVFKPLSIFTKQDIKDFMNYYKKLNKWQATTYNGYLGYVAIIFNWFVSEEKLLRSPVTGIEAKKGPVTRHKVYDDKTFDALKNNIHKADSYLFSFIEFIYYTCTRPKSEARLLQVKHLLFDRDLIQIPGNVAKNKEGDYVPMGEELKARLIHLQDLPADTYLWGLRGPAKKPASQNYFASLFKPFKDKLGLNKDYTIYGLKHTRCIHLVKEGANPYDIMRLFRHSSLEQTMKYMKDLGLTDYSDVLKKGRKF